MRRNERYTQTALNYSGSLALIPAIFQHQAQLGTMNIGQSQRLCLMQRLEIEGQIPGQVADAFEQADLANQTHDTKDNVGVVIVFIGLMQHHALEDIRQVPDIQQLGTMLTVHLFVRQIHDGIADYQIIVDDDVFDNAQQSSFDKDGANLLRANLLFLQAKSLFDLHGFQQP